MEINYDLIIKYLSPHKNDNNLFITPKDTLNYISSFPQQFKNIFSPHFCRYGITITDSDNNNISFWSSLLLLLNNKFTFNNDTCIKELKNYIIHNISKEKLSSCIKDCNIINNIDLPLNYLVIQATIDILNINIFVFDFKTENIYILYSSDNFNLTKDILLLANYNNYWEPIICLNNGNIQKIFTYTDIIIKQLLDLKDNIQYYNNKELNKSFDITKISMETTTVQEIPEKLNKTKLNKMKIDQLINLAQDNNLNFKHLKNGKEVNMTKKEILELLLDKLKI
jgi:hypothetical protein